MTTDEEDNYQKQSTPEKTSPKQQIKDNNNVKFTLLFFLSYRKYLFSV
jgi:hypothetical protein